MNTSRQTTSCFMDSINFLEVLCMITDAKCFEKKTEVKKLDSDLLVDVLLKKLYEEGLINSVTYLKAKEEKNV